MAATDSSLWLALVPVLSTLLLTFFGAVGAVWSILSKRITTLQSVVDEQGKAILAISEGKAKAEAERDLHKERSADLKQRLTVREMEVSEFKTLLTQALDMRHTIEEMATIRHKLDELARFVGDRRHNRDVEIEGEEG